MITVIDYGMGNLRSVVKAIEKYTADVRISNDPGSIKTSKALVMPGDGAFGMAMDHLQQMGWVEPLCEYIASGGYFFGICLGFQLLFSSSDEFGFHKGLDIIRGHVKKFDFPALKVPHMGWNDIELTGKSKFLEGIENYSYFYFIHSYYPEIKDHSWSLGEVDYGETFPCIVGKDNMIAMQFHPEKSHKVGLKIVENFVRYSCL
ncbi:MAG: imidazole glycerol phosphate synthase subunit HisH [Spirochaetes bacterium]|nr:imidazole glycerol phosphate synthase subunit HisH [Spirochaetota bacterium]